jgi:hypothetical protein
MENGKTVSNEVPALQGVDMWRVILEEADRRYMQKHILSETSFESSGDESEDSNSSSSASDLSECAAIQRELELENSFSSDCSQDLSSISISDVKRATCDRCCRFFHAEYVRARTRKSLLALAITGTPYLVVDDTTFPFLKECCVEYYDRWL